MATTGALRPQPVKSTSYGGTCLVETGRPYNCDDAGNPPIRFWKRDNLVSLARVRGKASVSNLCARI